MKTSTYPKTKKKSLRKQFIKYRHVFWFIIPALAITLFWGYTPMIGTLIAFRTKFDLTGFYTPIGSFFDPTANWTFSQFSQIFYDTDFIVALKNTLAISLLKIGICFPLSIITALLLSELRNQRLAKLILIIICLPNFLSWPVVNGIWENLMSIQGGLINNFLVKNGFLKEPFWFYGSREWFKPLVIFLSAWKGTGWGSIMFYASIMSIDKSYYEAASIEGASKVQKIWHLTLPAIMPMIALMLVMNITYILDAGFEQVFTMMNPETRYSQQIIGTYLYDISIVNQSNIPFAVALGVFNGAIATTFMLSGNALCKKTLGKGLW